MTATGTKSRDRRQRNRTGTEIETNKVRNTETGTFRIRGMEIPGWIEGSETTRSESIDQRIGCAIWSAIWSAIRERQ